MVTHFIDLHAYTTTSGAWLVLDTVAGSGYVDCIQLVDWTSATGLTDFHQKHTARLRKAQRVAAMWQLTSKASG